MEAESPAGPHLSAVNRDPATILLLLAASKAEKSSFLGLDSRFLLPYRVSNEYSFLI